MPIYVNYDSEGCYFDKNIPTIMIYSDEEGTTLRFDDNTMSWKETKHPFAGCTVSYPAVESGTVLGENEYRWDGNNWVTLPLDPVNPHRNSEAEDAYERAMKGI